MPSLQSIESWMLRVITHPLGVNAGAEDAAARSHVPIVEDQLTRNLNESPDWSAADRLGIYWNAYYSRLQDCLREEYPILRATVGEELFDEFVLEYLQEHPPCSYTLGMLGAKFPEYLAQTRPTREDGQNTPDWADFIAELAHFERTISEVFDGPGVESIRLRSFRAKCAVADRPEAATFVCPPCVKLLEYHFAVPSFHSTVKAGGSTEAPQPAKSYLAVTRQNYGVKHYSLGATEFSLLRQLQRGQSLGTALEMICSSDEAADEVELHIARWFAEWTRAELIIQADSYNS